MDRRESKEHEAFAATVRQKLKAEKLSQEKLAELIGVTAGAISQWLNDKKTFPKREHAVHLADLLDIPLDILQGRGHEEPGSAAERDGRAENLPEMLAEVLAAV